MSEVKRFRADWRHVVETEFDDAQYVGVADFDRVTAERDALQQRLNAADQKADDLEFSDSDRELSRRSWFEAAQAAEKLVEKLRAPLAERNALLRDAHEELISRDSPVGRRITAALSASAVPSLAEHCVKCATDVKTWPEWKRGALGSAKCDERACCQHLNIVPCSRIADGKFLGYFCKDCGMDRAALERKP